MNQNKEFCAITEQGDLGLGAEVFSMADQKSLNEQSEEYDYSDDE